MENQYKRRFKAENKHITLHTETTIDSAHHLCGYDGKCENIIIK